MRCHRASQSLLHGEVWNVRLPEDLSVGLVAEALVERDGFQLRTQHQALKTPQPCRILQRLHQGAPDALALRRLDHAYPLGLRALLDHPEPCGAHGRAIDPGEKVGALVVEPVELERLGNALPFDEHATPDRQADVSLGSACDPDDGPHHRSIVATAGGLCETRGR